MAINLVNDLASMMVSKMDPTMVLTKEQHLAPMTALMMELQMVPNLEKSTVPKMAPMMVSNLVRSTDPMMALTKEQRLVPMTALMMELQMASNLVKSRVPMMASMMASMMAQNLVK